MAKKETSTDVAVIEDPEQMAAVLAGLQEMEVQDASEFNAAQILRILTADTEEEAFHETQAYSSEDLIDVPLEVYAAKLLPSQFNNGKGAFVAADIVRLDTGERCILTSSASRVAARICWLQIHGKLPRRVVVTVLSEQTARGFRLLGLELVG